MSKKFSYDKAIVELNKIIDSIQKEEVSLDNLADMINKANILVNQCKTRLREIDEEVDKLTQNQSE